MEMVTMVVAAGRDTALAGWEEFLPTAPSYSAKRNHVVPGHTGVSRLSPAIRHRLLLEEEVLEQILNRHPLESVIQFIEGIYLRRYWRMWMEEHPGIWMSWRVRCAELKKNLTTCARDRCRSLEEGRSGCAAINYFSRELVELGYLHHRARLWFASWWVHVERLPWELGAEFFYRHLLDADAASNTLSWRAVAGLHTPGIPYLVQRSELERFCAPEILGDGSGLERIADGTVEACPGEDYVDPARPPERRSKNRSRVSGRVGLWLHGDDLLAENSGLSRSRPVAAAAFLPTELTEQMGYSVARQAFEIMAMEDAVERAQERFGCPGTAAKVPRLAEALTAWAKEHRLAHVVAIRPSVGEWRDQLDAVRGQLEGQGVQLHLNQRPCDARRGQYARRGFAEFWGDVRARLENRSASE